MQHQLASVFTFLSNSSSLDSHVVFTLKDGREFCDVLRALFNTNRFLFITAVKFIQFNMQE